MPQSDQHVLVVRKQAPEPRLDARVAVLRGGQRHRQGQRVCRLVRAPGIVVPESEPPSCTPSDFTDEAAVGHRYQALTHRDVRR